MSNVITGLFIIAILLSGVMMLSQAGIVSLRQTVDAWDGLQTRQSAILLTRVEVAKTKHTPPQVDITLQNTGQVHLGSFSDWDVFVQYYDTSGTYYIKRLTYTTASSPGDNQWTVKGIYIDEDANTAEIFQPSIFDPDEYLVVRMKLSPAARTSQVNYATIAVSNGVTVSTTFRN